MPPFAGFCTTAELSGWLTRLCGGCNLRCFAFTPTASAVLLDANELTLPPQTYLAYLASPLAPVVAGMDLKDILEKDWGLLRVTPAARRLINGREVLTLTQFDGGTSTNFGPPPSRYITRLRKQIRPSVSFGVRGVHTRTKSETRFPRFFYTPEAEDVLRRGGVWKQFPDDNGEFFPASL